MSETPDRTITGLAPRRLPAAAGLVKSAREPRSPDQAPAMSSSAPAPIVAPQLEPSPVPPRAVAPAAAAPKRAPRARPAVEPPKKAKSPLGVEISTEVRDLSRGAYRAAAYFEHTATYAQFVENAIAREIERLQAAYNGGRPFEAITTNLPAGRPVGS